MLGEERSTVAATTRWGMKDQLIFPEIDYNKVDKAKGMNICITTTAKTDAEGMALLEANGHAVYGQVTRTRGY